MSSPSVEQLRKARQRILATGAARGVGTLWLLEGDGGDPCALVTAAIALNSEGLIEAEPKAYGVEVRLTEAGLKALDASSPVEP